MSGDLISRKEAIDALYGSIFCADAIPIIEDLPIAYDVEAVVRELERQVKIHAKRQLECEEKQWNYLADQHKYYVRAFDEAIEIIKRGGRDDG